MTIRNPYPIPLFLQQNSLSPQNMLWYKNRGVFELTDQPTIRDSCPRSYYKYITTVHQG
jgi:hypothetical protein